MIRMSDIIKMSQSQEQTRANEKNTTVMETRKEDIPKVLKEVGYNRTVADELYGRGLSLIESVMNAIKTYQKIDLWPVLEFIRQVIESILVEENEQFEYFYMAYPTDRYLYGHSSNVCVLLSKIGIWSGLNKSELMELAIAGFLHDIGMAKVETIVQKGGALGRAERALVEKHPVYSEAVLRKTGGLTERTITAIKIHHQKNPEDKFSQMLGLTDIFEAMTHPRAYRGAKLPHQAITEIVNSESKNFHPDIIKLFINNIGIYPVGSWVKLNTEEIGIVVATNRNYPLRPKVSITFDCAKERIKETKIVDLSIEPYLCIEGPVDIKGH